MIDILYEPVLAVMVYTYFQSMLDDLDLVFLSALILKSL